ncbi:MAG TPA: limonene-1,2-epoxide hydrolase family protein [Ilumatobacteraceae bacterium]|nr:limonene-1,2-epoxide hydrolase family protein [Ilumatobacteraceae bacterium]
MHNPSDVVASFIAAVEAMDVDAAVELLTEDVSYENVPVSPIVGKEAVRATLAGFLGPARSVDWPVLREVVSGNVVVNERLDRFQIGDGWLELPVAGFFEVTDQGLISLWRDYFDMTTYVNQLSALTAT